jgi:hypothetical protein
MMQIISKGYFWFSCLLVLAGLILAHLLWPFMGGAIYVIKSHEYGRYLLLFGIGTPIVIANILECKFIWGRILRYPEIELLGVSIGFMIRLIIGYFN